MTKLLERRHMSQEEAEFVADLMIATFYLEQLYKQYGPLIERLNKGEFRTASAVRVSDLESARQLASALADERLPGQEITMRWTSGMSASSEAIATSSLEEQRKALTVVLSASTPSDWLNLCQQLQRLFSGISGGQKAVEAFQVLAGQRVSEQEFRNYRAQFEQSFARDAALLMVSRNAMRKPDTTTSGV